MTTTSQPKGKTGKADQALAYIQKLYAIERQLKGKKADERLHIRQTQAKPIIPLCQASCRFY
ncbi:transposase [Endozoicomonas sp. SM1973]|uniref:Transposase n=1 Tax=Spartinivicinus marinus TaxID=2994442 RepID=A0A853IPC9_9GAMM|nr:transposase [Spartinivicinus marinus]